MNRASHLFGALSIAGIPPFNGYASKQLISTAMQPHSPYTCSPELLRDLRALQERLDLVATIHLNQLWGEVAAVKEQRGLLPTEYLARCEFLWDRLVAIKVLRPEIVFFGEAIPFAALQSSERFAHMCDAMLVVGTSATVEPAASIPHIAKQHGARIIEINPEPTPLTRTISDISLMGPAGAMVSELVAAVEARL